MPRTSRGNGRFRVTISIPTLAVLCFSNTVLAQTRVAVRRLPGSAVVMGSSRNQNPLDSQTIPVQFGVQTGIEAWVEYNTTTCALVSDGSYQQSAAPIHGTISYGTVNWSLETDDKCNGVVLPWSAAYYTWTDSSTSSVEDSFTLIWSTPDGTYNETNSFVVTLTPGPSYTLSVLSPFLLGSPSLSDIELPSLLSNMSSLGKAAATGLSADGVSAAIVLVSTNTQSDVTLTSDNGTSLLPYDPQYLTYAPSLGGSTTLTIPAASLFAVGQLFYAAALVQTPPTGITPAYSTPITLTARQEGGQLQQINLSLTPPPVLLVHGLWGNARSLNFYHTTLSEKAPWSGNPDLVYPMSYPTNASFASAGSVGAIDTAVTSLQSAEQSRGFVGARVDVVAHSMGGLLVRSYSSSANYQQTFDRGQGSFNTIVTLDTPEAGSEMATYLLSHKDDTRQATITSDPSAYAFWNAVCGTASATTVGQCLSAKGDSVAGGAVASLVPMNPTLVKSPSPNIPGASWRAITATNTSGVARASVSLLLRSISPKRKLAASIDGILGTPNDDIVSLASQLTGSPLVYVTDPGLAHTGFLGRGIDEGVNNSPLAAGQAACWLSDPTSSACSAVPQLVAIKSDVEEDDRFAPGQLSVRLPVTATLGRPMSLDFSSLKVRSVEISQRGEKGLVRSTSSAIASDGKLLVVPLIPGNVRFDITAKFLNGSFDVMTGLINVSVDPREIVGLRGDPNLKTIVMPNATSTYYFSPEATIRSSPENVALGAFAHFRIVSPNEDPAVRVNQDGVVSVVHPGAAIVEVEFAGLTDRVQFLVR